jgi:hypothetical protein
VGDNNTAILLIQTSQNVETPYIAVGFQSGRIKLYKYLTQELSVDAITPQNTAAVTVIIQIPSSTICVSGSKTGEILQFNCLSPNTILSSAQREDQASIDNIIYIA